MKLRELFEAPATAVMAFGRMNPPTIGHAKLVDAIKSQPGDPFIFLSQSQKPKTDPLAFEDKLRYAKFFFPNVTIGNPQVKTIIQALQKVESLGYQQLIYVAGSDRVQAFEELLNKYNGKDFTFKSIKVVSAGERDPDADGAEGMSASKMRQAAADNDIESFKQGVPEPKLADEMFAAVRQGMGVNDTVPAESVQESTDNDKLLKALKKKLKDEGGAAGFKPLKDVASKMDIKLTPAKLKSMPGIKQHRDGDYILENKLEGPPAPAKIKVMKPINPPKAPDATIPVSRNGYTTDNGTTYKQDKYNDNLVHVSDGGGTYTFDGARMVKWQTPRIKGLQFIYDYVLRKIYLDMDSTVDIKDGDVGIDQLATYDMEGNHIPGSGSISVGAGGLKLGMDKDKISMKYQVTDGLSVHLTGSRNNKPSPQSQKMLKDMIAKAKAGEDIPYTAAINLFKKAGAKIQFRMVGKSIPFNQGIEMLKKASEGIEEAGLTPGQTLPKQIKVIKMPTPPQAPTGPDGTGEDGTRIGTTPKGNRSVKSGAGTYIFTPKGKLMLYMTPKMGGLQQTHNITKQTVTVNFGTSSAGGATIDQKATYDMSGKLISGDNTSIRSGNVGASIDKDKGATADFKVDANTKVSANSKTGIKVN